MPCHAVVTLHYTHLMHTFKYLTSLMPHICTQTMSMPGQLQCQHEADMTVPVARPKPWHNPNQCRPHRNQYYAESHLACTSSNVGHSIQQQRHTRPYHLMQKRHEKRLNGSLDAVHADVRSPDKGLSQSLSNASQGDIIPGGSHSPRSNDNLVCV